MIFGLLGLITGSVGVLVTAYLAYIRLFTSQGIGDRPLLLLGVMLIFIGVQLLTFGLLAEVMARTYYESQDKPTYVSLLGLERARAHARELLEQAQAALATTGLADTRALLALAVMTVDREN